MIEIHFDTEAMTAVRFGISPLWETGRSVCALEDPAGSALHLPWVERTERRIGHLQLDLATLRALQPRGEYAPDFFNPPPTSPTAEIEDELALMLGTPASQIRAEVERAYPQAPVPDLLAPFLNEPRRAVRELAKLLRAYYQEALDPYWPRIKSLLEHDVMHRARQIADGGTRELFADLDPSVSFCETGVLRIDKPECADTVMHLDERGLLLLPSVFVWPKVTLLTEPPWQPTLVYPARGVGMLWDAERPAPADALAKLVGSNRAAVLEALDRPRTTTELSHALGITSGGVSQHLSVLREAGLVQGRRVQRVVLYLRSSEGDALVRAAAGEAA